ncbi:MAG: flagellar biosynthesis protein FlhB [Alphaproteobacteria bacterium]|nr:flagellar biosynthesis protein FlhB [Alphaproteobacteria bacterium]
MAEEQDNSQKTEDPTQKRLDDARKKGDVVKSQDVPAWFLLMAAAAVVAGAGPATRAIADPLARIMDHPQAFRLTDGGAMNVLRALLLALLPPLGVIFGALLVGAVMGHIIQVRPLWTFEKIKPDLNKLSPAKGLERMFGPQGWMNLLKAVLKIGAVGVAMGYAIWPHAATIVGAGTLDPGGLLALAQTLAGRMFVAALIAIGLIAALDYLWQRMSFMNRMKMSRRDIRDEVKQSEGDPHIRAKLRMIRMTRAKKRMLAAVPKATVVINNPTHYSVALRYEPETDAAPVCVAKGVDDVALRIREVAKEAGVPMIENVPLARALFAAVEVDDSIPREHFEAVAKVIGFVLNTAKGRRR